MAASAAAAEQPIFTLAATHGAAFGVHHVTPGRLAFELAGLEPAGEGPVCAGVLAIEALCSRASAVQPLLVESFLLGERAHRQRPTP